MVSGRVARVAETSASLSYTFAIVLCVASLWRFFFFNFNSSEIRFTVTALVSVVSIALQSSPLYCRASRERSSSFSFMAPVFFIKFFHIHLFVCSIFGLCGCCAVRRRWLYVRTEFRCTFYFIASTVCNLCRRKLHTIFVHPNDTFAENVTASVPHPLWMFQKNEQCVKNKWEMKWKLCALTGISSLIYGWNANANANIKERRTCLVPLDSKAVGRERTWRNDVDSSDEAQSCIVICVI